MKGIYVHIPFCAKRCTYCSFTSGAPHRSMPLYVEALKKEIINRLPKGEEISTIYIGGGTPSVLYGGAITDILSTIRLIASVKSDAEITVECNPDSVTDEFVKEVTAAGVNRVSIGLQTTNDRLLKYINRPHDLNGFLSAWQKLSQIPNKSVDLMIGLPRQTKDDLLDSLKLVFGLKAPHVSLYALKVEPGTVLYDSGFSEDEDYEADLYDIAYAFLKQYGYRRYEVSNFCLDDCYSRHNFSYWDMVDYYGFGVSAHSYLNGIRYANGDNVSKYILGDAQVEQTDVSKDKAEEYIMLALRTDKGIDLARLKDYGIDLLEQKREEVNKFIGDGMLVKDKNTLRLSDGAFYIMNSIISSLI